MECIWYLEQEKSNRADPSFGFNEGVCGMDFLISDGSERFFTKVGRFGILKTAVRFGKHRKYCIKFKKTHIQIQTGAHTML
jgi:hypothetical protein